jgi:hypothetical protein
VPTHSRLFGHAGPVVVWVADWEMQCCGDPFAVGGSVSWHLSPVAESPLLAAFLGQDLAATVIAVYDHHASDPVPPPVDGVVRSVGAVFCDYELIGHMLTPLPGTTTVVSRDGGDGWEAAAEPQRFVGYLVNLET